MVITLLQPRIEIERQEAVPRVSDKGEAVKIQIVHSELVAPFTCRGVCGFS